MKPIRSLALAAVLWAAAAVALAQASAPAPGTSTAQAPKVLRYAFPVAETGFDPALISDLYSRAPSRPTSSSRCTATTTSRGRRRSSR